MYKFCSPIYNLKLLGDFSKYSIINGKNILDQMNENVLQYLGMFTLNEIFEKNNWYYELKETDTDPGILIHEISAKNSAYLTYALWIVKDNSIFSPVSFLYNNDVVRKDSRNDYNSNAAGKYEEVTFDEDEFILANNSYKKITDLLNEKHISAEPLLSPSGIVTGSKSLSEYNKFETFSRVFNFIAIARGTSLLPKKISMYIVALEALFGGNETNDLTFKLSCRIPHFFDLPFEKKDEISTHVKVAYSIRSKFLHGSKLDKKVKDRKTQEEVSVFLDSLLRKIILEILNDKEKEELFIDNDKFRDFFHRKLIG